MDDEQPTFKVTDRRLFNADGSPRDLPPEEPKAETKAEPVAVAPEPVPIAPEPVAAAPTPVEEQSSASAPVEQNTSEEAIDDDFGDEEIEGAHDPASFVNFMMSIASNAASALGMMEHPVTHQREVDLELGKHWIDVIGMLQKKTNGNLSKQEAQMLEGFLSDLRMQYVSLANTSQKPRTFSGRDITGGK